MIDLDVYFDQAMVAELESEEVDVEALVEAECIRTLDAAATFIAAVDFKRRLGGDATGAQMALDKKLCRKMAWTELTAYESWSGDTLEWESLKELARSGAEYQRAAAVLNAPEFTREILVNSWRNSLISYTALVLAGEVKEAQKIAKRYYSEQKRVLNLMDLLQVKPDFMTKKIAGYLLE